MMRISSGAYMWLTVAALSPTVAASVYLYGDGVWVRVILATVAAVAAEWLCLRVRRAAVDGGALGSAVIAGCIIGLCVPPLSPWYVPFSAALAGIILAKHCYGGLGNNPFNPAMAGYALALVAFPGQFGGWLGDGEDIWRSLFAAADSDAVSTPTPLTAVRLSLTPVLPSPLIAAAAAGGGAVLLALRIADWRLPTAFLAGAAASNALLDADWRLLLHGGLVFAAFFVVTDPVTAAATARGRWLYGFFVGALAVWLRVRGVHADGIAFAVLLGNMLAPLCDALTQRRR